MSDFLEKRVIKVTYDTSSSDSAGTSNKTTAAHPTGVFIPDNSIITNAYYEVETTFTSAGDTATIAIHLESADDIVAAIAINDSTNPWDAGLHGTIVGSPGLDSGQSNITDISDQTSLVYGTNKAASFIKVAGTEELTFTVATQALTAGKLHLYLEYVVGE